MKTIDVIKNKCESNNDYYKGHVSWLKCLLNGKKMNR